MMVVRDLMGDSISQFYINKLYIIFRKLIFVDKLKHQKTICPVLSLLNQSKKFVILKV